MYCERSATIRQKATYLTTHDGLTLFVRETCSNLTPPQRTLVIVHGAGEHSQRYDNWARLLAQHNWRVVSLDHRGYGLSQGLPGHVDRFDQYLADLDQVWSVLEIRASETIIFGHSLGGLISARYLQTRPQSARALVLSCPLLGLQLKVPAWKRTLGRLCSVFAPRTRFETSIRPDQLTRDPDARRVREDDPLRCRSVTASWYFQVLDALVNVWSEVNQLRLPVLLLQAEDDQVVSAEASRNWWLSLPSCDKTLRLLEGHLHELLSEPDWQETGSTILAWMEERLPETVPWEIPREMGRRMARWKSPCSMSRSRSEQTVIAE